MFRSVGRGLVFFGLGLLATLGLISVFVGLDCGSFPQRVLASGCQAVADISRSAGVSSDDPFCKRATCRAGFTIDQPFREAGAGRFWANGKQSEWLMWGSPGEPERDFSINVAWKSRPGQYNGALRSSLRALKRFKDGRLQLSSDYRPLDVHHGDFEMLPFLYRDQSLVKNCLGFTNKKRNSRVAIRGWLCTPAPAIPQIARLECVLSTLSIRDILQRDLSRDWCASGGRHTRS